MRIRQYEDGKDWAKQYFYVGGALTITTDGTNENFVKSENIIDPSGTILAARKEAKEGESIEGNQYWVYHYDAQGSVTNIVGTKDGALYRAEENVYDAFGDLDKKMEQSVSSIKNDIKFAGAVMDNSGLYYMQSRHYDPNTGRFLQQDTFKGDAYSPWTQNLYTYTSNNPVNYVDPTGHYYKEIYEDIGEAIDKIMFGMTNIKVVFGELGAAKDKKFDTTETPDEMKQKAKQQASIKKSKKKGVYGNGYNEHKANLMMELMIKQASEDDAASHEYGAFVYQREDGQYYISNVLKSGEEALNVISNRQFTKERELLGLVEDTEVSVGHTHLLTDYKNDHPGWDGEENSPVKFQYGSKEDAKTVIKGEIGGLKIKQYTIYAPIKQPGWNAEDNRVIGWHNPEIWPPKQGR